MYGEHGDWLWRRVQTVAGLDELEVATWCNVEVIL